MTATDKARIEKIKSRLASLDYAGLMRVWKTGDKLTCRAIDEMVTDAQLADY